MSNRKPAGWHEKHTESETDPAAVWVPVAKLKAWAKNPRKNDKAVESVAESIRTFGFGAPLLARKANGELIAGHTRLRAAVSLGLDVVPVRYLDLDESKAHLLALADNKLGEIAQWDDALLGSVLADLKAEGAALETSGFADRELAKLVAEASTLESDLDDVSEPPAEPITKLGDLWMLGKHRLLCGDSTRAETYEALLRGERAGIAFTSPPYNAAKNSSLPGRNKYIEHNDERSEDEYLELLRAFTTLSLRHAAFVFVNIQSVSGNKTALIEYLHKLRDVYADTIIWDKLTAEPAMASNVLNSRFEYVHVFSEKANRAIGTREFRGTHENVLPMQSRKDKEFARVHKATFPLEFARHFVESFSNVGEQVLEPFGGTGTTLIACEVSGRDARVVELSPAYCDLIIARWEALTGKKAERIDGQLREA